MSNHYQSDFPLNLRDDRFPQSDCILEVQILKLKLKEEKLRDQSIYQSLKQQITTR